MGPTREGRLVKGHGWTRPADLVAVLRRRWDSGCYLKAHARGEDWKPIALPVKGPNSDDLLHRFEDVRKWAAEFEADADESLHIRYRTVGGRHVGTNRIPARVEVADFASLCSLLGTAAEVQVLDRLLAITRTAMPTVATWAADHPLVVLENREAWPRLLATADWIARTDTRRTYVRQIDVEGVDTKFVERHEKVLTGVLLGVMPPESVDSSAVEFSRRFGFLSKPLYTRLRILDPAVSPFPTGVTEVALRTEELAGLPVPATTVFVIENEVTYLALPPVPRSVAIFGSGFASSGLAGVRWLTGCDVLYWGDIDTYGFEILSRLRGHLPHVRSILMDRQTLLSHRDHWSNESSPTRRPLPHLTETEQSLYQDLINDVYGIGVRLEQERVRFSVARDSLVQRTTPTSTTLLP